MRCSASSNTYLELLAADGDGPIADWVRATLEGDGEGLAALAFGAASLDDAHTCDSPRRAWCPRR